MKRKTLTVIVFVCVSVAAVCYLIAHTRRGDSIDLAEGTAEMGTRHIHTTGEFFVYINRKGELKRELKDEAFLNNKAFIVLEKLNINDAARRYFGSGIVTYHDNWDFVSNDGKLHLTAETLTLQEFKQLLSRDFNQWGKDCRIVIFADKDCPHAKITPILKTIKSLGGKNVMFAAINKKDNCPVFISVNLKDQDFHKEADPAN